MPRPAATIDHAAVAALADLVALPTDKGLPAVAWGRTVGEVVAARLPLAALPTPRLTLSRAALQHNVSALAGWVAERGLELCPHGKTTMAPQLWAGQLAAGAVGITVANGPQLAVARAFGVSDILVANALLDPGLLRWAAAELAAHPGHRIAVWADDVRAVQQMAQALADVPAGPPLDVLVELGAPGGRTGARDRESALAVARAVAATPQLRLAGVAGYEGALAHDASAAGLETVRRYLRDLVALHRALPGRDAAGVLTAGGSAYFDLVADELQTVAAEGVSVVLRSGAYVAHDDGFYRGVSPLGAHRRTDGPALRSALHGWARVLSQPEPGLALLDGGKRDLPFDEGLPTPQELDGPAEVTAVADQHAFLRWPTSGPAPVAVGDVVRLGLSHPCTAFDKWGLLPVVDDVDAPEPVVVDLVRTFF